MKITFAEEGWSEYLYWQTQDKKILKKINQLLQSIERDGRYAELESLSR